MTFVLSHQALDSFIGLSAPPAGPVMLARTSQKQMSRPTVVPIEEWRTRFVVDTVLERRCGPRIASYVDDQHYANIYSTQHFITGVLSHSAFN